MLELSDLVFVEGSPLRMGRLVVDDFEDSAAALRQLVNSDCAGLIPPCWQELHYLYAGILIGLLAGLVLWHRLYRWWAAPTPCRTADDVRHLRDPELVELEITHS